MLAARRLVPWFSALVGLVLLAGVAGAEALARAARSLGLSCGSMTPTPSRG